MLIVTEQAKAVLDGKIDDAVRSAGQTLRLTEEQPGTLGLKYDTLSESDQVVKLEGRPVLLVEPRIAQALTGATLEVIQEEEGPRLNLRLPQAE